jgi:DNA-binding FadR family transcriptional regulator
MLRNQERLSDVGNLAVSGELAQSGAEHGEILAAIRSRDRKRTEALTRRHLERVRKTWHQGTEVPSGNKADTRRRAHRSSV